MLKYQIFFKQSKLDCLKKNSINNWASSLNINFLLRSIEAEDEEEEEEEDKNDESETKATEDSKKNVSNSIAKPHECTICTRSFISQIGLQNHLWSHLPRERRFDGKPILRSQHVYSTNGVLHTNSDNNSSSNFVCPICSKKISTKGNLKVHLETHRPKGKYGCDICGRMYVCIHIHK